MKVPDDLLKLTTADENGGPEGSVGADLRAATRLNQKAAAQERCSHIETRIFMKVAHGLIRSPRSMKMAVVATVSAVCEPWVFHRFHKPTLPANNAVGVATKAGIFIEAIDPRSRGATQHENGGGTSSARPIARHAASRFQKESPRRSAATTP